VLKHIEIEQDDLSELSNLDSNKNDPLLNFTFGQNSNVTALFKKI
jgi:hypothetical protein